jgi:L-glyceraldehyde 3-phosphate reductase
MFQFPSSLRYDHAVFRPCGRSGLVLPPVSLGLWQNFGGIDSYETGRAVVRRAFDRGVTHFDLANNYGPPPGSAEESFGRLLATDLKPYRDELILSSKAGYVMGLGPYGDGGSRKYLLSSLDASLKRLGLDYVDIFYHHRPDRRTPLEESMTALADAVRSGRALYVGLSNYPADLAREAAGLLRAMGTPCLVHQPRYSMIDRTIEAGLLDTLEDVGAGCAIFSPLAQGLLTGKYLHDTPTDARMARGGTLPAERLTPALRTQLQALHAIAVRRGQSMAQMALAWALRDNRVTTALVGARTPTQLDELLDYAGAGPLAPGELSEIDAIMPAAIG